MRKLLVTLVAGLMVSAASAQVRIFLDPAGVGEQIDRGAVDNLSYGNPAVDPAINPRLYLYVEYLAENDLWLGIGVNLSVVGGDGIITGGSNYLHRTGLGNRWSNRTFGISGDQKTATYRAAWIGNPDVAPGGMWNWDEAFAIARTGDGFNAADMADAKHYRRTWDSGDAAHGTTLMGYVDLQGTGGDLFFDINTFGIARVGGSGADSVYFGYGDPPVRADDFGVRTRDRDGSIVPEPASLMLLGLGALALRRRR